MGSVWHSGRGKCLKTDTLRGKAYGRTDTDEKAISGDQRAISGLSPVFPVGRLL
jgi:hypothetical protein